MSRTDRDGAAGPAQAKGAAPRLHARIRAALARRIADGSLPPGARLHEFRLAEEFGVSRAPVRQALAALEAQRLIVRADGQGFTVLGAPTGEVDDAADSGEPIVAQASWQGILRAVEMAIVPRTALGSWRVVEAEIARAFGVSRTVAREVVARLNQRGLVKRDQRARWYAPALTGDHIRELYEMRWTLEPAALGRAFERAPSGTAQALRASLSAAKERGEALDGRDLDRLEAELHVDYLGHCGNGAMAEALALYQSLLVAHTFIYAVSPAPHRSEPFLPEHEAVIDALCAGRSDAASGALEAHLRAASERAVARVETLSHGLDLADLPWLQRLPS